MKSKLDKLLRDARLIFLRMTEKSDSRALFLLTITGFIVGIFWWFNATLVYDDVILAKDLDAFGFRHVADREGWLKALAHFFVLDLPDQYRTYGLSRLFQFLLWTFGISSAPSYALLISFFHLISTLALYALLTKLKFARHFSLAFSLLWMFSPFIWTSCFHHYSYLTLPTQILIIGSYFLLKISDRKTIKSASIALGIVLGLTGELHLLTVPLVLFAVAILAKKKNFWRAAIIALVSMVLAILVHYTLWKIFEADPSLQKRFALNVSYDLNFWFLQISSALKSIYLSITIPLAEIVQGQSIFEFIATALFSTIGSFLVLSWVDRSEKNTSQDSAYLQDRWQFAGFLFASAFLYLLIYILLVSLTTSVPPIMPRRYGYVPLTLLTMAVCAGLSALIPQKSAKIALLSLFIGAEISLFIWHQAALVPNVRAADEKLSGEIAAELKNDPRRGVLFFNSSNKEFPRTAIFPDSFGPSMQNTAGTELTQSIYGSYWSAEMNITRIMEAPFACGLVGPLDGGKRLRTACPYGTIIKDIEANKAIIVANLGFDEFDPFGNNVKVFESFSDFEPYFFSRMIITDTDPALASKGDFFGINFNQSSPNIKSGTIFPNKEFDTPPALDSDSWLKNYGWVSPKKEGYKLNFSESDLNIYLDFRPTPDEIPREEIEIKVSWNKKDWTSLGKMKIADMNNGKPFSVRLSHLNTSSFEFKLFSESGQDPASALTSIRVEKRESSNPLK